MAQQSKRKQGGTARARRASKSVEPENVAIDRIPVTTHDKSGKLTVEGPGETKPAPEKPELPNRERIYITQLAEVLAYELDITESAARIRLYRGIEAGTVRAVRILGTLMIQRDEAARIIEGERT